MSGVVVSDLVVEYVTEGYTIRPLNGLSFDVEQGELVVLLGPSGSGKTTLLSCLGGMLRPTAGSIRVNGTDVTGLSAADLGQFRRNEIGFVFQAFNLIPSLSARENVAVPLLVGGTKRSEAMRRAEAMLEEVGLEDRMNHKPSKLSGGQQQRVAVARGLIHQPDLLLADEPTANLDHVQAEAVIQLLLALSKSGRTIIVSTHDSRLVPVADRVVNMTAEDDGVEGPPTQVGYVANEEVFAQGDHADFVYVIEDGEVEIFRPLADGTEEHLALLGPGNYFGELGSMLGFPRSASARARTAAKLTAFSPSDFRKTVLDDL